MKSFKFLALSIVLAWVFFEAHSQVIFSEDFENGMPGNFKLINQDGLTPDSAVLYVNDAWVTRPDFDDQSDTVAVSTSWYSPPGMSNDWMITPPIDIDSFSILSWEAKAQDPSFPDGYEVRISTGGDSIPDFLTNFTLFNTNAEEAEWTSRQVNLADEGYMNQTVYIAFRNNSSDQFLLLIDDIVVTNPFQFDAAAISIQGPESQCMLSASETIEMTIENNGFDPISNFDVSYVLDDGDTAITVTEQVTQTIQPQTSLDYTFSQTVDLSAYGDYAVYGFTALNNDADLDNDTTGAFFVSNVEPYDVSSPFQTSFESVAEILGWTIEDANSDGFDWHLVQGVANTGNISYIYEWNQDGVTPADDWLFSTCLDLDSGSTYKLSFYHRVGSAQGTVFPEKLAVYLGMAPASGSMTDTLEDLGTLNNDAYMEEEITFTSPSTGTYYIGFYAYSDADDFFLALDDISLELVPPPVADFTYNANFLDVTFNSTSTNNPDNLDWDFGDGNTDSGNSVTNTYGSAGTYHVCLTASNMAGSDTYCDSVTVLEDTATVILKLEKQVSLGLYPNPVKKVMTVNVQTATSTDLSLSVYDLLGNRVYLKELRQTTELSLPIDLSDQPQGMYFLQVDYEGSSIQEKFMIVR